MSYTHILVVVAWLIATSILNVLLRMKTPEQWVALADKRPRLHAIIRIMRAIGCDPVKLVTAVVDLVRSKAENTEKKS